MPRASIDRPPVATGSAGIEPAPDRRDARGATQPTPAPTPAPAPDQDPTSNEPTRIEPSARDPGRLTRAGRLGTPLLTETSGLATSTRSDTVLWALNDSGHRAELHALDARGRALARLSIEADNRDWEALESGTLNGIPSLVIGETGDNLRRREGAELLVLPEPDVAPDGARGLGPEGRTAPANPVRRIPFTWPEPGHDVEAMSLDAGVLWMLDKPPLGDGGAALASGVFQLDLESALDRPAPDSPLRAVRVGDYRAPGGGLLAGLASALFDVDLSHPTGLELDAVRGHAWVLTYRDVLRYDRQADEPWQATLAREPARRWAHGLAQAEALAIGGDGTVFLTSEGRGAPLLRIDPE